MISVYLLLDLYYESLNVDYLDCQCLGFHLCLVMLQSTFRSIARVYRARKPNYVI